MPPLRATCNGGPWPPRNLLTQLAYGVATVCAGLGGHGFFNAHSVYGVSAHQQRGKRLANGFNLP